MVTSCDVTFLQIEMLLLTSDTTPDSQRTMLNGLLIAGTAQSDVPVVSQQIESHPYPASAETILEERTPAELPQLSPSQFIPWQPVESGSRAENSHRHPAPSETVATQADVPKDTREVPASDLSVSQIVNKAASAAEEDHETSGNDLTDPYSPAVLAPNGKHSSATFPGASDKPHLEQRECQPAGNMTGSGESSRYAELSPEYQEDPEANEILPTAEAQLVEGCAVGPVHPRLLSSDVNGAALMKPVRGLDGSEKKAQVRI